MKYRMLILTLASLAFAQEASAQDRADPFTGPSFTIVSGYDHQDVYNGGDGVLYGAAIGYDTGSGRGRFGVEAEATGSTADSCYQLSATSQGCVHQAYDLYAGVRAGVVVGPVLLYGKAGYTNAREHFEGKGALPPGDLQPTYGVTLNGYRVGAGVESSVGRFLVRAEYRYSDYGSSGDRHQVVAGVGVRF